MLPHSLRIQQRQHCPPSNVLMLAINLILVKLNQFILHSCMNLIKQLQLQTINWITVHFKFKESYKLCSFILPDSDG